MACFWGFLAFVMMLLLFTITVKYFTGTVFFVVVVAFVPFLIIVCIYLCSVFVALERVGRERACHVVCPAITRAHFSFTGSKCYWGMPVRNSCRVDRRRFLASATSRHNYIGIVRYKYRLHPLPHLVNRNASTADSSRGSCRRDRTVRLVRKLDWNVRRSSRCTGPKAVGVGV
jgi:hypothetical protein